jgi:hypothetical protein
MIVFGISLRVLIVTRLHRPQENTYEGNSTYPYRGSLFEIEKNRGGAEDKSFVVPISGVAGYLDQI